MSKTGPIILVEDDIDDQELTKEVIAEMQVPNEVICFSNCDDALAYLMNDTGSQQPFIILSDVNLPKTTGMALKEKIDRNPRLRRKSIPFVFYTTSASRNDINDAYEHRVQGYFLKESSIKDMKETLELIFAYWSKCRHPSN